MTHIAKIDSFIDGRFVSAGFPVTPSDKVEISDNLIEVDGDAPGGAVVEISAIAPTGPNPKMPQQLAPDMLQTVEGYAKPGAKLVAEVTLPAEQRIEIVGLGDKESTAEADAVEAFEKAKASGNNDDDALVAGTASELQGTIDDSDAEALDRLEAAERDRERPRKGVLSAIDKRRSELQG